MAVVWGKGVDGVGYLAASDVVDKAARTCLHAVQPLMLAGGPARDCTH